MIGEVCCLGQSVGGRVSNGSPGQKEPLNPAQHCRCSGLASAGRIMGFAALGNPREEWRKPLRAVFSMTYSRVNAFGSGAAAHPADTVRVPAPTPNGGSSEGPSREKSHFGFLLSASFF
jgi:hypothetical protein